MLEMNSAFANNFFERSEGPVARVRNVALTAAALITALLASDVACAQTAVPLMYQGTDRTERLVEGAKKEGVLNLYTSMAEKDDRRLVDAFEKKYGIKIKVWRSGKNIVLQRVITEARAGRYEADFVLNPAPEMEALVREKLLQPVNSPVQKDLIPAALPAHHQWTGMRVYLFIESYNTNKVRKDELPKTYADLLDPRWKGRIGIEAKQQEWFYTLVQSMGEEKGLKYFRDLVKNNQVTQVKGNSVLTNMVTSGEVPLAMGAYSYLAEQQREIGAPIDYIALAPTIAYTDGLGIPAKAPHPYAATLFYDFMFTDGQKIVAENKALTTNKRDQAAIAKFKPVFMDPPKVLDTYDKWGKLFDDTLNGR
jgi:iron(III) transport system substrate-binding protein